VPGWIPGLTHKPSECGLPVTTTSGPISSQHRKTMITITNSDLKSAIAGLGKVVSNKSTLECLRCIRVDATPERSSQKF
jgi:hypothetical protein